ncbi:expressed unknown protein [Seminavis robusta]|uniref:Uncharacterized protein n=1 Tax=Seminavis robusta TaxID=568900 RepID=A0A9N8HYU9_9STRA|nr:expressed unknown protein [Seminavis robusta]|eukprot:Sro3066_g343100.1 n/a (406) ;mRNA; f:2185-3402
MSSSLLDARHFSGRSFYNVASVAIVLSAFTKCVLDMGGWLHHDQPSSAAVAIGVTLASCVLAGLLALALRKSYKWYLRLRRRLVVLLQSSQLKIANRISSSKTKQEEPTRNDRIRTKDNQDLIKPAPAPALQAQATPAFQAAFQAATTPEPDVEVELTKTSTGKMEKKDIKMDIPWATVFEFLYGADIQRATMASKHHNPWRTNALTFHDQDEQQQVVAALQNRLLQANHADFYRFYHHHHNHHKSLPKLLHCLDHGRYIRCDGFYCQKDTQFRGYLRFYPDGTVIGVRRTETPSQMAQWLHSFDDSVNVQEAGEQQQQPQGVGRGTYQTEFLPHTHHDYLFRTTMTITLMGIATFHCVGLTKSSNGDIDLEYTSELFLDGSVIQEEYTFVPFPSKQQKQLKVVD